MRSSNQLYHTRPPGEEDDQQIPGGVKSNRKMKNQHSLKAARQSLKVADHQRFLEKSQKGKTEMTEDARRSARLKNNETRREFFLSHAPLAEEHKRERAEVEAVINEVLEDRNELHFNFQGGFNSP